MGSGYLNITSALASTDLAQGTAMSPVATQDQFGNVVLQPDPSSIWGSSVIWGNSVIRGNNVIWGSSVGANSAAESIEGAGDSE